jgi:hypothetical protein
VSQGKVPREEVGITDSHFTIVPCNGLNGDPWCVVVSFTSEKLHPGWALGVDIVTDWDTTNYATSFGIRKRHTGLSLFGRDGK